MSTTIEYDVNLLNFLLRTILAFASLVSSLLKVPIIVFAIKTIIVFINRIKKPDSDSRSSDDSTKEPDQCKSSKPLSSLHHYFGQSNQQVLLISRKSSHPHRWLYQPQKVIFSYFLSSPSFFLSSSRLRNASKHNFYDHFVHRRVGGTYSNNIQNT